MMQAAYREPLLDNGEIGLLSKFTSAEDCIWIVRLAWREAIYCADSRDISFEPVFSPLGGMGSKSGSTAMKTVCLNCCLDQHFFHCGGQKRRSSLLQNASSLEFRYESPCDLMVRKKEHIEQLEGRDSRSWK